MTKHWLLKTEPAAYSIDDLARDTVTAWSEIRNYQARNFLKEMARGDAALLYHSQVDPPSIVGLAKVVRVAYPDPTQFDRSSEYFDGKATADKPRWFSPDVKFVKKFRRPVSIGQLRHEPALRDMVVLQCGSRLSVQPVTEGEFRAIERLSREGACIPSTAVGKKSEGIK